jgi:sulfotransferase
MLSGLPRTGSTVLTSMLNQHTEIHATTTSPLADFIISTLEQWPLLSKQTSYKPERQLENIIRGIIDGTYKHIDKSTIIDKNRLWPRISDVMQSVQQNNPKIICTVRQIPEILSSYILLFDSKPHQVNFVDEHLKSKNITINTKNRCKLLWEVFINHPYKSLMMGYNTKQSDMLFLDYNEIVDNGQQTIDKICNFIGIDSYTLNVDNLQPMDENDKFHGFIGLHDVRKKLKRTSPKPEDVIGEDLVKHYNDMRLDFWNR